MAIVLIGFMGAGKSTAARELAGALGRSALDSDELLAEQLGHSVAEEFERGGEAAFREAEERLVCELLARAGSDEVIALGGGSVLSPRVREALAAGHVTVLLDIDADTAWERIAAANGSAPMRPLAADPDRFRALHGERRGIYEELAEAVIGPLAPGAIAAAAPTLKALQGLPRGTRMLWARSAARDYPVLIGDGLLTRHGPALLSGWPFDRSSSRAFAVSDANVAGRYMECLGSIAGELVLEPGEAATKTIAGAERLWRALVEAELTRADHLLALGGGVVGDLGGFCAATYQRGIPVVQVPTTVVAQVDSAYGGKTGVDLPEAKNYVGVYHQPSAVLVDPLTLDSLDERESASGWVEVLKTAMIAGGELWEDVAGGRSLTAKTIFGCARTKLGIVAADERDGGRRQVLNLGHTVGHAIETATGYGRYRHGEAIGLGLLAALRLSGQDELRARVLELLRGHELPVSFSGTTVDEILAALRRDKKRTAQEVPFVLVQAPGEVTPGHVVAESDLRAAVGEIAS